MEIVPIQIEFQFSMYSKTVSVAASSRRKGKHYKSDHTQTCQNTTILYYHESKKSSFDDPLDTTPLLDEDENEKEPPMRESRMRKCIAQTIAPLVVLTNPGTIRD